jgi:hypothetical protein
VTGSDARLAETGQLAGDRFRLFGGLKASERFGGDRLPRPDERF